VLSAIGDDILALQRGNQHDVPMPTGASGYIEPAPKSIEGSII
jgi:hypothetical protein